MEKLTCKICGKELDKDNIILTIKERSQRVVNVETCCRGECHDKLEMEKILEGYHCGFWEMNTSFKDLVLEDEFQVSLFEADALKKYKEIVALCNS